MAKSDTDNFKEILEGQFEKQAVLINNAFSGQKEHFDKRLDGVDRRFDSLDSKVDKIDERLQVVETKLDRALYTELTHIEARLRKVEEKVGIK